MLIEEGACLRRFNTFGVAARARQLIHLQALADLPRALELLAAQAQEPLILGGGSNLLIAGDIDGPVLRIDLRGRQVIDSPHVSDDAVVEAAAGEPWDEFVRWTLALGLYGLENLSLIPGTVGASPMQNIGAYGVEMRERFESLDAVHLRTGERRVFKAADCAFGYRDSIFRKPASPWLIVRVRFLLSRTARVNLGYPDLRNRLDPATATPQAVAAAVNAIRRSKLPDPALLGNAGSFFRNPVVDWEVARALRTRHAQLPVYPAGEASRHKLSAGWLIEQCGWKGHREGDAGVHADHALVLVNHGQATGAQLLALARAIQTSIRERFGIELEPEPRIVGASR